ncbi:MAG: hypothetical protein Q9213_001439 [Squamulea squamosa]
MGRLSFLVVLAAAVSFANAFCVDFNSADQCTGTVVGTYFGSRGTGCQTAFTSANSSESVPAPGGSFNVVIQPQSNDSKTGVAFFGQPDCEVLIGFGNVPVCTGIGAWSSFKIISIDEADDQLTNLDPAPILSIPSNATAAVGRGQRLPVPTDMPQDTTGSALNTGPSSTTAAGTSTGKTTAKETTETTTSTTSSEPMMSILGTATPGKLRRRKSPEFSERIVHGSIHQHQGCSYKYHQMAKRAWRGVPVAEWHKAIHKRNTKDHTLPVTSSPSPKRRHARAIDPVGGSSYDASKRSISPHTPGSLEEKSILPAKCNLVRSCLIDTGDNDGFGISEAGPALLSALERLNPNGTNWQFLRDPFVVEVTDDSVQPLGFIYAQTIEHSGVSTCSGSGTESDAFKSALEMGVAGSTVSDMRVDLKLLTGNGVTNSLFVSTRKVGNADMNIHPICEAIEVFD